MDLGDFRALHGDFLSVMTCERQVFAEEDAFAGRQDDHTGHFHVIIAGAGLCRMRNDLDLMVESGDQTELAADLPQLGNEVHYVVNADR